MKNIRTLSVAKFGGSLLTDDGNNIPAIVDCVIDIRNQSDIGPIVVFSAPNGFTNKLIQLGESCTKSGPLPIVDIFNVYENFAEKYVNANYLNHAFSELKNYRRQLDDALALVDKRFHGTVKAKVLTNGGELPTSVLMDYIFRSNDIDSCHITKDEWPIITDDNFENATPNFLLSKTNPNRLPNHSKKEKLL